MPQLIALRTLHDSTEHCRLDEQFLVSLQLAIAKLFYYFIMRVGATCMYFFDTRNYIVSMTIVFVNVFYCRLLFLNGYCILG